MNNAFLFIFNIDSAKDDVKDIKMKCLSHPYNFLWSPIAVKVYPQIVTIFNYLKNL